MPFEATEERFEKFFKYFIVSFVPQSSGSLINIEINDWQAIIFDSL